MDIRPAVAAGGCQCGGVRYAFYAPLENAHACHCRMCQRATGGVFALLVGAKKADFAWTKGDPAVFESSNLAKRHYCRDCGTPLSFTYNLPEARFYVTIGSLDDPEQAPIQKQYGVESRASWVKFCDEIPGEVTGSDASAAAYLAKMENHQA